MLVSYAKKVEVALEEFVKRFKGSGSLGEACAYAMKAGGKRYRPAVVLMIAEALGNDLDAMPAAIAVECFHTASLIADDLPCMDDDDLRRGQPAVHKRFGEPEALLATYTLIAEGYGLIAENGRGRPGVSELAYLNVAKNTGIEGASGGQALDLNPPDLTVETLREVIQKKTGALFEAAFVLGWLFGGGDPAKQGTVEKAAHHLGMAFQIADDLDDVDQDREINMVSALGKEASLKMFHEELSGYYDSLEELEISTEGLKSLAQLLEVCCI